MNTFKNVKVANVSTLATVYTGQVGAQTTLIGMSVANVAGAAVYVDVKLGGVHIVQDAPVPVGSSLVPIGGDQKIVMEAGDVLEVEATGNVDVIVSMLEIS